MVAGGKEKLTLAKARAELAGARVAPLDVDSFGIDEHGHVAIFLGDDDSPPVTDAVATEAMLAALFASASAIADTGDGGYRVPGAISREPIFDAPLAHEEPFEDFPHLVVASANGAETVRNVWAELGGREVLAQDAYGVVFEALGYLSYEELHMGGACAGCRAVDPVEDPKPRSPEALAMRGLFVYAFANGRWRRLASPSVPIELDELSMRTGIAIAPRSYATQFETARIVSA